VSYRARVVSSIAGFRGAISLAIALSVPETLDSGGPFTGRDDIIVVTAGVIVLTLLVQGPILPAVVRWADLPQDASTEDELRLAERAITTTAVAALPELVEQHGISEEVRQRLVQDYEEHLRLVEAKAHAEGSPAVSEVAQIEATVDGSLATGGDAQLAPTPTRVGLSEYAPLIRNEEYTRLRVALLERKREVLLRMRHDGTIDDSVARRIQTRLDIEELRLIGVEPID
jgi:NhaP-type Na+/H+ or K+/H+ antiporter